MKVRRKGRVRFFVVALLIFALAYCAFFGISSTFGDVKTIYIKGASDIRWGIDIQGGVEVTYTPPADITATKEELQSAESVIKQRLISQNIADYELYTDQNSQRIIVRFPWKEGESNFDPMLAIKELGETAQLTFREGTEATGTVVLEGKDIRSAKSEWDSQEMKHYVALELNSTGKDKFADATGRLLNKQISIWMDETMISAPTVQNQISNGNASITGTFTAEDAQDLAAKINAGALPFKLETKNYSTINPTLGKNALDAVLLAGIIAFALVAIFMILLYKLPGGVAVVALLGQVAFSLAAVSGLFNFIPSFTLTLPGIAGIILSIGMGVDANVITCERIRDELKLGKTLDSAIVAGQHNSFSAIFDGNITVIIVSIILMGCFGPPSNIFAVIVKPFTFMFGAVTTGEIYSFGFTLLLGVIANFIFGVSASRAMVMGLSKFKPFRNKKLYGGENNA